MLSSRPFNPAPTLSDSTPAALGSAAAGVDTTVSRADHVHAMPSAADVGAPELASTVPAALGVAAIGVGTTAARADHVHELPASPLPTTPGLALLDLSAPSRVLVLNALGGGDTQSYDTVGINALSDILGWEAEGDFVVGNGAGGVQLASSAPAAVRALIGVGGVTSPPTTLAAYARAEALRRRGPLAMRTTTAGHGTTAASTTTVQPSINVGTSGVVVFHYSTLLTYGSLAQNGVWGTRGWYMSMSSTDFVRIGFMLGTVQAVDFPSVLGSVGWISVAWSIAADGLSARYSFNGGAAANATLSTTPLTPVARDPADTVWIATNGTTAGTTPHGLAYLALWSSVLSDADLALLSANPSEGAPDLDAISGGAPAWEWAAAAFAGVDSVTIGGTVHSIAGTPLVWMP